MNKSAITIVALAALTIGFVLSWILADRRAIELEDGIWFGEQSRPLPEFELVDHHNRPFTRQRFEGKWNLLFFGYTHCPDICPTSLQTLGATLRAIDDADVASAVRVYFVSVDPKRDTPERLAGYVTYFDPRIIGVTGPVEKLMPLTRTLGIAHERHDNSGDSSDYTVDHSGAIALIGPAAEFAGLFSAPHDALAMARDLARIVERN